MRRDRIFWQEERPPLAGKQKQSHDVQGGMDAAWLYLILRSATGYTCSFVLTCLCCEKVMGTGRLLKRMEDSFPIIFQLRYDPMGEKNLCKMDGLWYTRWRNALANMPCVSLTRKPRPWCKKHRTRSGGGNDPCGHVSTLLCSSGTFWCGLVSSSPSCSPFSPNFLLLIWASLPI